MNEIEHAIEVSGSKLSELSKKAYNTSYNRLMVLTENRPIHTFRQAKMIALLSSADMPPMSKNSLLNAVILIRKANSTPIKQLNDWRDKKLMPQAEAYKDAKNQAMELPSVNELSEFVRYQLQIKDNIGYIINYLLFNYGVRNLDLNILITRDKSVSYKSNKAKMNYLYITKKYCRYQRSDYKTHDTYGQKVLKITSMPFLRAVNELLRDEAEVPLLQTESGELIAESSLNNYIQRKTYKNFGEGKYFKALVSEYAKKGNMKKLKELSDFRGTDLTTMVNYYNV